MKSRLLRRTMGLVAMAVMAGPLLGTAPAAACSCAPRDLERTAADASHAFVGRQIERVETDSGVILTFAVLEAYKGDLGATIDVRTGFGSSDCGTQAGGVPEVGVLAFGHSGGMPSVSSCGSLWDPDEVRYHFAALPAPSSSGPPAFYLGMDAGGSRGLLVDAAGTAIAYGVGKGRILDADVCPGGDRLVEAWLVDGMYGDVQTARAGVAVRTVPSLEVVRTIDVTVPGYVHQQDPWLRDLACHDPTGDRVSYAVTETVGEPQSGRSHAASALLVLHEAGTERTVDLGDATSHAVSYPMDRIVAIVGFPATQLRSWEASTGSPIGTVDLPGGDVGRRIAASANRIGVIARDEIPDDRENWSYPDADRIVAFDADLLPLQTYPFERRGRVVAFEAFGDRFVGAIHHTDWADDLVDFGVFGYDTSQEDALGGILLAAPGEGVHTDVAFDGHATAYTSQTGGPPIVRIAVTPDVGAVDIALAEPYSSFTALTDDPSLLGSPAATTTTIATPTTSPAREQPTSGEPTSTLVAAPTSSEPPTQWTTAALVATGVLVLTVVGIGVWRIGRTTRE